MRRGDKEKVKSFLQFIASRLPSAESVLSWLGARSSEPPIFAHGTTALRTLFLVCVADDAATEQSKLLFVKLACGPPLLGNEPAPPLHSEANYVGTDGADAAFVDDHVRKGLEKGWFRRTEHLDSTVLHPLSVVRQSRGAPFFAASIAEPKRRVVHDFTAIGVNDTHSAADVWCEYDDIRKLAISLDRESSAVVSDRSDAYMWVHMRQCDRGSMCFEWRGHTYELRTMPMGWSPACRLFQEAMVLLSRFVERAPQWPEAVDVYNYIDDASILGHGSAALGGLLFDALMESVGLAKAKQKGHSDARVRFSTLGCAFDCDALVLSLPDDKRNALLADIEFCLNATTVAPALWERFVGRLQWAAAAYAESGFRLATLHAAKAPRIRHPLRAITHVRRDLFWWKKALSDRSYEFNVQLWPHGVLPTPSVSMATDAAIEGGVATMAAAFKGRTAAAPPFAHDATSTVDGFAVPNIASLEAYAVLFAIRHWRVVLVGQVIFLYIDNSNAFWALFKRRARSAPMFALVDAIGLELRQLNARLCPCWTPSADNDVADSATRASVTDRSRALARWRASGCVVRNRAANDFVVRFPPADTSCVGGTEAEPDDLFVDYRALWNE